MTGIPSSQIHFNVKAQIGAQKMQFRHPDRCPLITGFTVYAMLGITILPFYNQSYKAMKENGCFKCESLVQILRFTPQYDFSVPYNRGWSCTCTCGLAHVPCQFPTAIKFLMYAIFGVTKLSNSSSLWDSPCRTEKEVEVLYLHLEVNYMYIG